MDSLIDRNSTVQGLTFVQIHRCNPTSQVEHLDAVCAVCSTIFDIFNMESVRNKKLTQIMQPNLPYDITLYHPVGPRPLCFQQKAESWMRPHIVPAGLLLEWAREGGREKEGKEGMMPQCSSSFCEISPALASYHLGKQWMRTTPSPPWLKWLWRTEWEVGGTGISIDKSLSGQLNCSKLNMENWTNQLNKKTIKLHS